MDGVKRIKKSDETAIAQSIPFNTHTHTLTYTQQPEEKKMEKKWKATLKLQY